MLAGALSALPAVQPPSCGCQYCCCPAHAGTTNNSLHEHVTRREEQLRQHREEIAVLRAERAALQRLALESLMPEGSEPPAEVSLSVLKCVT